MAGPYANGAALKTTILDWAARPDLVNKVDEFLRLAEIALQRELKLRFTDTTVAGTLTEGDELLLLPTDLIDVRSFWIIANGVRCVVPPVSFEKFVQYKSFQDGIPRGRQTEGLSLKLAPTPGSALPYELPYRAGIPALTDDTSNWLLDNGPDALLYRTLMFLAVYTKDPASQAMWKDQYTPAFEDLRLLEVRARYGGGPIYARPVGPTP